MEAPWRGKSELSKVIAAVATIGIAGFGLCTAGVLSGLPESDAWWAKPLQRLLPLCGVAAMISVPILIVLLIISAVRNRGGQA